MTAVQHKTASAVAQTCAQPETFNINAKRQTRCCKVPLKGVTRNAKLAAAIDAMIAACEIADPLADAHTAAENALAALADEASDEQADKARAAERRADERWQRAYRAAERAGLAVLRIEVDTAEDALLQTNAYAWSYERRGVMDLWAEDLRAPLASAMRALKILARQPAPLSPVQPEPNSPTPADDVRKSWEAALAAWTDVRAQYDACEQASAMSWRAVAETAPAEIVAPGVAQGLRVRWRTLEELDRDILLSEAEKADLRPLLEEHYARQAEYHKSPDRDADEQLMEDLYDKVADAESALLNTTPPDLAALAFKQHLDGRSADDDRLGYDDLGYVSYLLGSYRSDREPVILHMDTLRMAGIHHPILDMEPFKPRNWIAAYEAAGGFVSAAPMDELLLFPAAEAMVALTDALQGALEATPWKYRAVQLEAEYRRNEGGDPVFDGLCQTGTEDNRGGKRAAPLQPYRRVERITFGTKDGVITPLVQSLHRQGDQLVQLDAGQAEQAAA